MDREDLKRYEELNRKLNDGTITDEEYDEMFHMEQDSIEEECLYMAQFGM